MVVGEETPDEGAVSVPRKLTMGYFRQDVEERRGRSVLDEAIAGSGRVGDLHHELEALQRERSDPDKSATRTFSASSITRPVRRVGFGSTPFLGFPQPSL
jgi:ATPase subunit of ABC transporter with duplicated ATPase domains